MESIESRNDKRQWHGYQEIYDKHENLWCRSTYKNDLLWFVKPTHLQWVGCKNLYLKINI
jgi:hypothetical protein